MEIPDWAYYTTGAVFAGAILYGVILYGKVVSKGFKKQWEEEQKANEEQRKSKKGIQNNLTLPKK